MKAFWILALFSLSCSRNTIQTGPEKNPKASPGQVDKTTNSASTPSLDAMNGAWIATMGGDDRCTLQYVFSSAEAKLNTVLSCYDAPAKAVHREIRSYSLSVAQGSETNLHLVESSCPAAAVKTDFPVIFSLSGPADAPESILAVNQNTLSRSGLRLARARDLIDPDFVKTTGTYRNFPVVMGCFPLGQIAKFTAL